MMKQLLGLLPFVRLELPFLTGRHNANHSIPAQWEAIDGSRSATVNDEQVNMQNSPSFIRSSKLGQSFDAVDDEVSRFPALVCGIASKRGRDGRCCSSVIDLHNVFCHPSTCRTFSRANIIQRFIPFQSNRKSEHMSGPKIRGCKEENCVH